MAVRAPAEGPGVTDLIDTTEMYLRTIYELSEEGIVPLRARIAERLGHSGPTVSQTVARMERDGLVVVSGDRHLELTPDGYLKATRVMRKHRLAERLLTDVIGLEWSYVHEEACRWEHVMSDRVEKRLVELLDHPRHSPYGNPIPGLAELGEERVAEQFLDGVVSLVVFARAIQDQGPGPVPAVVGRLGEPVQTDTELLSRLRQAAQQLGVGLHGLAQPADDRRHRTRALVLDGAGEHDERHHAVQELLGDALLTQLGQARDRVAVRRVPRVVELLDQPLLHPVAHHVLPAARLLMHVRPLQADHVREQPLGEAVLAHHPGGLEVPIRSQLEVPVTADHHEAVALHPGDRLRHRRTGVAETLRDPRTQRDDALLGQLVDRPQVHLGGVDQVGHAWSLRWCAHRHRQVLEPRLRPTAPGAEHHRTSHRYAPRDAYSGAVTEVTALQIPADLLPADGRFGSGPSKVRPEQISALAAVGRTLMDTSHRQAPVRAVVERVRTGLAELFAAPDGYEVVLGNGGSTAFWDLATFSLIQDRAQLCAFGEFGTTFARAVQDAPFLAEPTVRTGAPGTLVTPEPQDRVDTYAWPHNETSAGVAAPVEVSLCGQA